MKSALSEYACTCTGGVKEHDRDHSPLSERHVTRDKLSKAM